MKASHIHTEIDGNVMDRNWLADNLRHFDPGRFSRTQGYRVQAKKYFKQSNGLVYFPRSIFKLHPGRGTWASVS